jgi:hypothetical protein
MSLAPAFQSSVCLNDAARGLTQQMVFWGHDVRHPDGNSLVRFGLARSPSPGLTGTSCYSMPWENGRIELHGAVASWTPELPGNGSIFCRDRARIDLWTGNQAPIPGRQHGFAGRQSVLHEANHLRDGRTRQDHRPFVGRLHPLGCVFGSLLLSTFLIGGELAQSRVGLPSALSGVFQGVLLFSLLTCDTLIGYRLRFGNRSRAVAAS